MGVNSDVRNPAEYSQGRAACTVGCGRVGKADLRDFSSSMRTTHTAGANMQFQKFTCRSVHILDFIQGTRSKCIGCNVFLDRLELLV